MNLKRIVLAAMAAVAVASFVDPVAAQSAAQAATPFWLGDALNWIADNSETIVTVAETIVDVGETFGLW